MSKFRSNMQVFHVETCLGHCSGVKRYRSCYLASKAVNFILLCGILLLGSRLK